MAHDLAVLTAVERAAVLLHRDAAWACVQERRLAPQLAPILDDVGIVLACYDEARADVDRLTAERDAARAALATLTVDMEHFAHHGHRLAHDAAPPDWRSCGRGVCPGLRRALERARAAQGLPPYASPVAESAVARARAATGGGADAPRCPESGGEGGS